MSQILGSILTGSLAGLCFGIHHYSRTIICSNGVRADMPITGMFIGGVVGLVIGSYPATFPFCGYLVYGMVRIVEEIKEGEVFVISSK